MPEIVIKRDRTKEPYSEKKVKQALQRIGVSNEKQAEILSLLQAKLPRLVTTKQLYRFIFSHLDLPAKTKYNLKKALSLLGPAGYPFEHFIAHLLQRLGYQTKTNIFLQGKCVMHEIDVIATKDQDYFIEAKFHHQAHRKNNIKTALYFYGRAIDLSENYQFIPWLWTNTKFTKEAIDFAICRKIKLTSWNFPEENLAFLIEKTKSYPVTILTSLNKRDFQNLIKLDIILIEDLLQKDTRFLSKILARKQIESTLQEAKLLR